MTLKQIATAVRGRRQDLGLSQAALAQRAGVSRKWVYEFEAGKPTAELGLVLRIFDALGMDMVLAERDESQTTSDVSDATVALDKVLDKHGRQNWSALQSAADRFGRTLGELNRQLDISGAAGALAEISGQLAAVGSSKALADVSKQLDAVGSSAKLAEISGQLAAVGSSKALADISKQLDAVGSSAKLAEISGQLAAVGSSKALADISEQLDVVGSSKALADLSKRLEVVGLSNALATVSNQTRTGQGRGDIYPRMSAAEALDRTREELGTPVLTDRHVLGSEET